ncbi:hypothetical protein BJF78_19510 [Pseudonocardia sp. CNS-139]|nr:hypothetical protein BJF78_19510 [Pseudonocardia sp. CNS-139]
MDLSWTSLRALRELDRRGTMHAAAKALGYTPSAVSQQIAALETAAGCALIVRVGRGVALTPEGTVLARHADTLLEAGRAAIADLGAARDRVSGRVRVGMFAAALSTVLPGLVDDLHGRHPGVRVHARQLTGTDLVDASGPARSISRWGSTTPRWRSRVIRCCASNTSVASR